MRNNFLKTVLVAVTMSLCGSIVGVRAETIPMTSSSVPQEPVEKETVVEELVSSYSVMDYVANIGDNKEYIFRSNQGTTITKGEFFLGDVIQFSQIIGSDRKIGFLSFSPDYMELTSTQEAPQIRSNLINERPEGEIILKAPLKVGNTWESLSSVFTIVDIIEADGKGTIIVRKSDTNGDYYMYFEIGKGLVLITDAEGNEITKLMEIRSGQKETKEIILYYPGGKEVKTTLGFNLNDTAKNLITNAYREKALESNSMEVLGLSSSIQYIYRKDNILYVDLDESFIDYINSVKDKEDEILQSLTNTLLRFYGADALSITINDQRYESDSKKIEKFEYLVPKY